MLSWQIWELYSQATEEELDSILTLESERVSVLNAINNPSTLIKGVDLPKETSKSRKHTARYMLI